MRLMDSLTGAMGDLDIDGIAGKLGLDPQEVQLGLSALGQSQAEPGDTAQGAADKSGLPIGKMQELLSHIGGEGALGGLGSLLGGQARS